ncbi:GerAB/ArcD/ProY family transporter [Rossellomorea sp. BNER]|uniref:GerAB/ArcD/ProY family transporter n=1 Tax=Rossellomorea sp. BNER TaxID=2962031 RepID=UPI003AF289D1|nr:spore germination protein [Rossellomorea sp. BNER]
MKDNHNKISPFQLSFLILQTQIGVGVLSLPYTVYTVSKGDAWISTLLAGLFVQLAIVIIWFLCRRYPQYSIFRISTLLLGRHFSILINLVYLIYFVMVGCLTITLFSRVLDIWVLPLTPNWVPILLLILTTVYLINENLRIVARFYVVVSFLLIFLFLLVSYSIKGSNLLYIMPIGNSGVIAILKGSKEALISMLGFEVILVAFASTQGESNGKLKAATFANIFVTLFYAYLVFICSIYFSPKEIVIVPEPVLYLLKAFSFTVIERTDLIFLSIWIISVATSVMTYLYLASNCLSYLFKKKSHRKTLGFVAVGIFICAIIPQTEQSLETISGIVEKGSLVVIVIIPLFLLLLSLFKGTKEVDIYE